MPDVSDQVSELLTDIGLEGPARVVAGVFLAVMAVAGVWTVLVLVVRAGRPQIDPGARPGADHSDEPKPRLAREAHLSRLNTPIESHNGLRAGNRVVAKHGSYELPARIVEIVEQRFLGVVMRVETEDGFRFEARARDVRAAGAREGTDAAPRPLVQVSASGAIRVQEVESIRAAEGKITQRSRGRGRIARVFSRS